MPLVHQCDGLFMLLILVLGTALGTLVQSRPGIIFRSSVLVSGLILLSMPPSTAQIIWLWLAFFAIGYAIRMDSFGFLLMIFLAIYDYGTAGLILVPAVVLALFINGAQAK